MITVVVILFSVRSFSRLTKCCQPSCLGGQNPLTGCAIRVKNRAQHVGTVTPADGNAYGEVSGLHIDGSKAIAVHQFSQLGQLCHDLEPTSRSLGGAGNPV